MIHLEFKLLGNQSHIMHDKSNGNKASSTSYIAYSQLNMNPKFAREEIYLGCIYFEKQELTKIQSLIKVFESSFKSWRNNLQSIIWSILTYFNLETILIFTLISTCLAPWSNEKTIFSALFCSRRVAPRDFLYLSTSFCYACGALENNIYDKPSMGF